MKPQPRLITLQAITFLHPGTGQSTGVVDLPIQREVHTGYPMFASSGFKGSLRDKAEQLWKGVDKDKIHPDVETLFGSTAGGENPNAGCLSVTDARILAFPVRSLQQVFVWITCPMVIERLQRDRELIELGSPNFVLNEVPTEVAWVTNDSPLKEMLILEDVSFNVTPNKTVDAISNLFISLLDDKAGFDGKRLVVIPNDDFQHLVRFATQISARNVLNKETKTSENLWYEETLPPETIMYALALCHNQPPGNNADSEKKRDIASAKDVAKKLQTLLENKFLQIGGNETVGQGWCCVKINGGQP